MAKSRSNTKKVEDAERLGRVVAKAWYEEFRDHPEYRGERFVWPDTLLKMVPEMTDVQCGMSCIDDPKYVKIAVEASRVEIERIIRNGGV